MGDSGFVVSQHGGDAGLLPGRLVLAGGAFVGLMSLVIYNRRRAESLSDKETNGMPGSAGLIPLLDQTASFGLNPRKFLRERFTRYGPVFRTRVAGFDMVCLSGAAAATLAYCNDDLFDTKLFDHLMKLMDGFMLVQNGKEHRRNRNLIVRALSDTQLKMNLKGISEQFHAELAEWAKAGKQGVEVYLNTKRAILKVMMHVLFGDSIPSETIEMLVQEIDAYGRGLLAVPINLPFTTLGKAYAARDSILKRLTGIIEDRREFCKTASTKPFDLLQTMLDTPDPETGECADTDSIARNSITILMAAVDTTASTVASIIRILYVNTEVREKVIAEVKYVWPSDMPIHALPAEEISNRLAKLTYLDCVLQETLRVRAPLMCTFRFCKQDVRIPDTDYIIPKNYMVGVAHDYTFTSDSKNFPDPEKFIPERFLPNGSSYTSANFKNSNFPFSKGIHMCPGNKFAIAETKIIVSMLAIRSSEWPEIVDPTKRSNMGIAGFGVEGHCQTPSLEEIGGMRVRFY